MEMSRLASAARDDAKRSLEWVMVTGRALLGPDGASSTSDSHGPAALRNPCAERPRSVFYPAFGGEGRDNIVDTPLSLVRALRAAWPHPQF